MMSLNGKEESILSGTPAALFCLDRTGRFTWLNPAASRVLGLAPGVLPDRPIFDCVGREDAEKLRQLLGQSDDAETPIRLTVRWATGTDTGRWLGLEIDRSDDASGRLIGHMRDATLDVASRDIIATSGDMLRRLEEIGRTGLWWWYPRTDDMQCSDGSHRILGFDDPSAVRTRQEFSDLIDPDDKPTLALLMDRAARTGDPFECRVRIGRTDGALRHVQLRAGTERDPDGSIVCVYGIMQDIHDEVETNSARRLSEERYARTVRGSGIGLWDWDITAGQIHASGSFMQLLGYEAKDCLLDFSFFASHIHVDDRTGTLATLEASVENGKPLRCEFRMHRRDGRVIWVRAMAETRRNGDRKPSRMSGSVLDITVEKNGQIALEAANVKLTHMVDSSAAILYTAPLPDADRDEPAGPILDLTSMSGNVEDVTGYSADQINLDEAGIGHTLHPDDRLRLREAIGELRNRGHVTAEYRVRHRDGRYRWLRDDMRLARNPVTQASEIIGCAMDFTSAKRAEQELIDAKDAAQAANKAKSDFLAMMSHEIRTPMNAVLGMLDLLRRSTLDDQQSSYVVLAQDSAKDLLSILNDILDLSKLDAGRMDLETLDFDLHRTIEVALSILGPKAEDKGLVLESMLDPGIPEVLRGDSGRFRQVLLNLVSNAIKFTERGSVQVTAMLTQETTDDVRIRVEVTDTGIGISEETCQRLFSHFVQADSSIKRRFGGTGLGLAISKQLCALMGGDIGVDSAEGEGSTFWFELPFERSAIAHVHVEPLRTTAMPARGEKRRILVAEDNAVNQTVISTILGELGHSCTIAKNGREAIDKLRRDAYDLVLMDVQMPVMDGVTATKVIRVLPDPLNATPVIALTANAMAGDREAYMAAGFSAYLAKPINIDDLHAAIEAVIGEGTGAGSPRAAEERPGADAPEADEACLDMTAPPLAAGTPSEAPAQPKPPSSLTSGPARSDEILEDLIASIG